MSDKLGVPDSPLTRDVKPANGRHEHDSQISETVLETTNEGFVVWDARLKLVAWSKQCPDFWYEPGDILRPGMPMVELLQHIATSGGFGPGDPDKLARRELRRIRKAGKVSDDEFEMRDGRVIHVQRSAMPDGGHSSTYTDISERRRVEVALRVSKERYKTLFHQSPLGVTVEDYSEVKRHIDRLRAEGVDDVAAYFRDNGDAIELVVDDIRLIDANDTMIQMFGTSSFDEYEKYESDYILAEGDIWREFYINEFAAFASGEVTYTGETSDIRPDGTPIDVRCTSRIVESAIDDWSQVISTHEDTTSRKLARIALEESEARYREIFDEAPMTMWVEDWSQVKLTIDRLGEQGVKNWEAYFADNRESAIELYDLTETLETSNASLKLYGATDAEEYLGALEGARVLPEELEAFVSILLGFIEGRWEFQIESEDTHMSGNNIEIRTRGIIPPARRADWSRLIYSMEDITEIKAAEVAVLKLKEEAEQANLAKSQFLAHMSHELRTPLNAITGFAAMMTNEIFGEHSQSKYLEYAHDILGSGQHLIAVVSDILDLSKIEAGEINLNATSFSIHQAIEDCFNAIRAQSSDSPQRFTSTISDGTSNLYADHRAFRQILLNLLSNSNKFTPTEGRITVITEPGNDDGVVVRVSDTGIGIAAEDLISVLEPFNQVRSNMHTAQEGTGLGLPLSQKLMELHGGTLELESELGVGTCVTLTFPAVRTVKLLCSD